MHGIQSEFILAANTAVRRVVSEYVFTSFGGRGERLTAAPMSAVSVWRTVQHYAAVVGLAHVKPHDVRRFVGTHLAKGDIRRAKRRSAISGSTPRRGSMCWTRWRWG